MYHLPPHLGAMPSPKSIAPIGLSLPPMAGFGATTFMPNAGCNCGYGSDDAPNRQATPGELAAAGGIGLIGVGFAALVIGGMGYLIYQEVQLKKQIVEKGGGEALMKYELGRAAGTVASGLFLPKDDYRRNRKGKRRSKKRGR